MSAYRDKVLADAPVTYWRLDELTGNFLDLVAGQVGTPSGTLARGVAGATSDQNGAVRFDGATSKIAIAPGAMGTTVTIEAWVYSVGNGSAGTYEAIVSNVDGSIGLFRKWVGSKLSVYFAGDHLNTTALSLNQWHHVVVSIAAGSGTFYVDGLADGTFTGWPGFTPVVIGQSTALNQVWNGTLDEVALYPTALTQAQVSAHYTLGIGRRVAVSPYSTKVLADGALAYWRLDEPSGNAIDAANGRVLVVTGTPTYSQSGATSDGNAAVSFPGGALDEFAITDAALRPTAGVTLEFWYKPAAFPTVQYLVACGDTGNLGYRFHTDAAATAIFTVGNGTANTALSSSVPMVIGNWHHLVGTYDGTNVRLYLNGALVAGPTALTGPIGYGAITQFVVAQFESPTAARQLTGVVDEVAVYGYALTPTQVDNHYETGLLRDVNAHLQKYFKEVLYVGTASNDLTTNLMRRVAALTGDVTARVKSIIVSAGTKN